MSQNARIDAIIISLIICVVAVVGYGMYENWYAMHYAELDKDYNPNLILIMFTFAISIPAVSAVYFFSQWQKKRLGE